MYNSDLEVYFSDLKEDVQISFAKQNGFDNIQDLLNAYKQLEDEPIGIIVDIEDYLEDTN